MDKNSNSADKAILAKVTSSEAASRLLGSRKDLSHSFFEDIEISDEVARQSLFYGVLFRNCKISDCDFSRSDFEGVRFENCVLQNISFETCDVRSTHFFKTKLDNCVFRSSVFTDNILLKCSISECDFENASLTHNTFQEANIRNLKNRTSTWLHTTFDKTKIEATIFSDCTSSYSMYLDCNFDNVRLNADSLGLTYGLSHQDVSNLDFSFLGRHYDKGTAPEIEEFIEQYRARRWVIHELILKLNFSISNNQLLLFDLINSIYHQLLDRSGAKRDDIEFIFKIIFLLNKQNRLPFSVAIHTHDLFGGLRLGESFDTREKALIELAFQNSLLLANTMQEKLEDALHPLLDLDMTSTIEAQITYKKRQKIGTIEYIEKVQGMAGNDYLDSKLIQARKGSWVEIIQTTVSGLLAMYLALYLFNGCLAQLTMTRARVKTLFSKRLPKKFIRAASEPGRELPKHYLNTMQKLYESQIENKTSILEGLSAEDIQTIEIQPNVMET
jgi:uncharacterized protein YjbI with pentapeptide repeats